MQLQKRYLKPFRVSYSSYGNLANERVIARIETLSCTDPDSGLVLREAPSRRSRARRAV